MDVIRCSRRFSHRTAVWDNPAIPWWDRPLATQVPAPGSRLFRSRFQGREKAHHSRTQRFIYASMYLCVCVYVCVCVCIYIYVYICTYIYIHVIICVYIYIYVYLHTYIYKYKYICIFTIYIKIYIHRYIYIYTKKKDVRCPSWSALRISLPAQSMTSSCLQKSTAEVNCWKCSGLMLKSPRSKQGVCSRSSSTPASDSTACCNGFRYCS